MVKKNIIPCVLFASVIVLSGCENDVKNKDSNNKHKIETIVKREKNIQIKDVTENNTPQKKSIFSSGDKLIFESEILQKGNIVFNQTMGRKGVVTGAVVITLEDDLVPADIKNRYSLSKLSQHNYKLLADKDDDLQKLINTLNSYKEISNVEISVDYSPINTQF